MTAERRHFLAELRRRKVYHVAAAYVAASIVVATATAELFDDLLLPDWTPRLVILLLVIGFPIALVLAWAYEVRPEELGPVEPVTEKAPPPSETPAPTEVADVERRKSIVVLPFDNLSPDPADAYFSDGLTEEVITNLSHLHSLRVISRNSAMVLKGTQKSTRAIAEELNVQFVLEGSVRKAGNDLRISAQLIHAAEDEHLWAETYHGTMEDVFLIQEQTARSIVDALRLSLTPEEDQRLAERPIEDVQAYECYLMARREYWAGTADGLERARRHLENGLEIVGENVVLLQGLAEMHLHAYEAGIRANEETLRAAEDLADRITALKPDSPYSHYIAGRIERFRGSCTKAAEHWERALDVDPDHSSSLLFLNTCYALQAGRVDEAWPLRERILAYDPLNILSWYSVGMFHWMRGELEEALSTFRQAGRLVDGSDWVDAISAYIMIWQNRRNEAVALVEDLIERDTPDLITEWALFLREALKGEGAAAHEHLSEETRRFLWNDPEFVWLAASTFALAGQKEEALDWLEHAVDRGWINYPLFAEQDPLLESVRSEDRFKRLMKRVKREWEDFGSRPGVRLGRA